jgi:hypothetical protein
MSRASHSQPGRKEGLDCVMSVIGTQIPGRKWKISNCVCRSVREKGVVFDERFQKGVQSTFLAKSGCTFAAESVLAI